MYTLYGIPNCNTVKKTMVFLESKTIPFRFHNYKKDGISADLLKAWCQQAGWKTLLNKKGTTWRALSEVEKAGITNTRSAVALMAKQPSLIKRPVITNSDGQIVTVGYDEDTLANLVV